MKALYPSLVLALCPLIAVADEMTDALLRQQIEVLRHIRTKEQADAAAMHPAGLEPPDNATESLYDEYSAAC